MNRHVATLAGRMSLRLPQRRSLEILDRIIDLIPVKARMDPAAALAAIRSEFATVSDFEREFPSLCFALATGVGKTRLMGAFIAHLHLAHGLNNFFVMAPNLTIYNKLISDFTPHTPKYVFHGISEFAAHPPIIVTGENYEQGSGIMLNRLPGMDQECVVNIFNIAKINSEVRGGKAPRIKRLSEYIGQSYFDYLAGLDDLVLIMDESHRYRATAGVRAIHELKPVLGLELTATPYVETGKGPLAFKNVILDYSLAQAMTDGFVKEPAVVTRKDFNPQTLSPQALEQLKLEDGVRLHESVKVELETYAREAGKAIVKPFMLIIARDTSHASELMQLIQSVDFFGGRYLHKVIQVDSSRSGAEEDAMVERLLKVEHTEEPTEIVIHVNMLKEGWDVTNLYTIVPLRAAKARVLVEQSIGRGLRLPYGRRTGVAAVDRLNIIAHDKFQEIIDETSRPDSPLRLQTLLLSNEDTPVTGTVVSACHLDHLLAMQPQQPANHASQPQPPAPLFAHPEAQRMAQITYQVVNTLPDKLPTVGHLQRQEIKNHIVAQVMAQYTPATLPLDDEQLPMPDLSTTVETTLQTIIQHTIDIPRILVIPKGEVNCGFYPFTLHLSTLHYPPPSDDLWVHYLRTQEGTLIALDNDAVQENRLEDYIVAGLLDFNDISYEFHKELLYTLAGQTVDHLRGYLTEDEARRVLRLHQKDIARFIHAQMQEHYWQEIVDSEVIVSSGFTPLKAAAYTASLQHPPLDLHHSPADKSNMAKYLFSGFQKCLYPFQKFHSEAERHLAILLEREASRWFKPVKGQFNIFYQSGPDHLEYQPDFVAELAHGMFMLEVKAANQLNDETVLAKQKAARQWCQHATNHCHTYPGGKPWSYLLLPHDVISDNMTLQGLIKRYTSMHL
ncbi:MAG: DEAD/DEAH box helicase family protein [Magnetococcales bacterium]|nr:DEAD/DEAH box helicase family protein [Magnetococcales bacterium]NGZ28145.1 DEAD/DEAH box helicase family protein [Magnetococcales bacterium]